MAEGQDRRREAPKPVLQGFVVHRKRPHRLRLTRSHIHWENTDGKGSTSTTVPLSDVLAVQVGDAGQHGGLYFRLHYIHKRPKPNFQWKHDIAEFRQAEGETNIAKWVQKVNEQQAKAAAGRPRRLLVFVNPVSGGSKGRQIYSKYGEPLFRLCNIETEVVVTDHSGHIKEHLLECDLSSFDGLVVTGGDGTFTEACAGLIYRKMKNNDISDGPDLTLPPLELPIGLIPAGTGQGQVKRATGTCDAMTAVLHIITGDSYQMDAFCVHDDSRLVGMGTLLCGCGLYSNMIEASEKNRWLGRGRYAWGAVKVFTKLYKYKADVEVYLFQVNEDGSLKKTESGNKEVVQHIRGAFLDVNYFCMTPQHPDAAPGVMFINCYAGTTNRKIIIKHTLRMLQMQPDAYDFECLKQYKGYKYRIRIDRKAVGDVTSSSPRASLNGDVSQTDVTSTSSGASASDDVNFTAPEGVTYHLKPPDIVNIDGDPFPINGEWLQVKALASAIRMYGHDHKNVI